MSIRFDELTKALGKGLTRRQALGRTAAYTGGSLFGLLAFARQAPGVDVNTCNLVCRVFTTAADRNRCLAVCRTCPSLAQLCGSTAANLACYPSSALSNASGLVPVAGVCRPVCNAGFIDCDGNTLTGCETNIAADAANCGSCNHVCAGVANGTVGCSNSVCTVFACNPGFADCDQNAGNGCETNISTSINNCGSCGHVCSLPNTAVHGCTGGSCTVVSCNPGFADCDNLPGNGCETNINTSVANCGSCGHVCSLPNTAVHGCTGGSCTVVSCNPGFADCDNLPGNGCETNINTSVANCGSCGHVCFVQNGTAGCSAGACIVASCNAGFADCDQNSGNGCETNILTDRNHCGTCNNVCGSSQTCSNGSCH